MAEKGGRTRRSPEVARAAILAAAERLLVEGGLGAVQVRAVARAASMTDAGVTHHFGDLQGLLTAMLEDAGRRARATVGAAVEDWLESEVDIERLVRALAALHRQGYAELAVALHAAGWRDRGEPIFGKVVEAVHRARLARTTGPAPDILDTQLAVAALHQAVAMDQLFGEDFRRSAGLKTDASTGADRQLDWWIATIRKVLDL